MKKLTSILLALVLSLTLVFTLALSGCHLTDEDISSSTGGGTSSSTEPQAPQKTDRSAYTIQAADETVKALTLNGLFLDGKSALKGYMAGDMLNSAIETLAKSILDGAVDAGVNMEQLAAQFSYFEYEYYDDGSWYAKKDGKKVHPVLDAFLSYKLDGSEELKLTPEMLDYYKNETLLFIAGYENDQKYQLLLTMVDQSGVIDTIMHAKVGDVAKIFSGDAKKVMEGVNAVAGNLTIKQIAMLLGFTPTDSAPAFAVRIGAKKVSEVMALMNKTDEEKIAELKVLFKDATVGEVAAFVGFTVTDETVKAMKVEAVLDDYVALKTGDYAKKVALVEKMLGETTAVELLTSMQIPLRTDMQDKKLKELSAQANSEAEGNFEAYLIGLFNAVYSYADPDAVSATLDSILAAEVIPGVTVNDVIGALSAKDAFAPVAYKFYLYLGGTEIGEEVFTAKLNETFYPFVERLAGIFNEEKLVGDYTITGLIAALGAEETRAAAEEAIKAEATKLQDEAYAAEWFAKLATTLNKAMAEIDKFAKDNLYDLTVPFNGGKFTIGDAAAYINALKTGAKVDENNSLYKLLDKITVGEAIEALKKMFKPEGNQPAPDVPQPEGTVEIGEAA